DGSAQKYLIEQRAAYNSDPRHGLTTSPAHPTFHSLFLLNADGAVVAYSGPDPDRLLGGVFNRRNYFQGALARCRETGSRRVHVSRVFHSESDQLDKFAIAVALRPVNDRPAGVLVGTITTDATLGLGRLHDDRRKAVLLAPKDMDKPRGNDRPFVG